MSTKQVFFLLSQKNILQVKTGFLSLFVSLSYKKKIQLVRVQKNHKASCYGFFFVSENFKKIHFNVPHVPESHLKC